MENFSEDLRYLFYIDLRYLFYIVGQDQAEVRLLNRHSTENTIARTREAITRSEALLDRLRREAAAAADRVT